MYRAFEIEMSTFVGDTQTKGQKPSSAPEKVDKADAF